MENPAPAITNAALASIYDGLSSLDGVRASPSEFRQFVFDSDTIWIIAENSVLVQDALKVFERAKKVLAATHDIQERMQITPQNADRVNKFMSELDALLEKPVPLPAIKKISRGALNVGNSAKQNPIPASVLAKIAPVLEE